MLLLPLPTTGRVGEESRAARSESTRGSPGRELQRLG